MTTVVWLRQDLRLDDNPALRAAAARGPVAALYILDESGDTRPLGGASRWWLHQSLTALARDLDGLILRRGDPKHLLPKTAAALGAEAVFWNRRYEAGAVRRDTALKTALVEQGFEVRSFNGALLHEPWEVATKDGGPYKVYTPFWRACLARPVAAPTPAPRLQPAESAAASDRLADWGLAPTAPNWAADWTAAWRPGEAGASARLDAFLQTGLSGYGDGRNRPDQAHVSRLSPHLHFGELSPRRVWARVEAHLANHPSVRPDAQKFLAEIGWREFSSHLLYHFPDLPTRNWKSAFDHYPWRESAADLRAWRRGETGYPFVDAGLRELWATGYMHNRVRMAAASFLVKHLRLHWREGEAWFWDTLVDADLANNAAGWQWVAGSGADAAPYFRIFNPVSQGEKFDPDGAYVRRWIPELERLPAAVIHRPWEARAEILATAGVRLGADYPRPIVDHAEARKAALAGYEAIKGA